MTKKNNIGVAFIVWLITICQPCFAQPHCKTQEYGVIIKDIDEAPVNQAIHGFSYSPLALIYGKWAEAGEDTTKVSVSWDNLAFSCQSAEHGGSLIDSKYMLTMYSNYRDVPDGEVLFLQLDYRLPFSKIARVLYREDVGQIDKVERFQYGTDQFLLVYSPLKAGDLYKLKDYPRPICVERSRLYVYRLSEDYTFTKMLEEIVSTMPSDRSECFGLVEPRTKGSYFIEGGEQFKIHFSFSTTRPVATRNYEKRYVYMLNTKQFVLEYTNFKE